jgi:hypothetical protein
MSSTAHRCSWQKFFLGFFTFSADSSMTGRYGRPKKFAKTCELRNLYSLAVVGGRSWWRNEPLSSRVLAGRLFWSVQHDSEGGSV